MSKACLWRGVLALCFAAMMVAVSACDGSADGLPREPVSGTVTLDGEPLAAGAIQFFPKQAGGVAVSGGSTVEDGQFSISREYGLVPGSYKVAINASESSNGDSKKKGQKSRKKSTSTKDIIPAKYNSETTLTAEIEKGCSSRLKYDLQSK